MSQVVDFDKTVNDPNFLNCRQKSDEAVKQAYCKCPYPVKEAANIEAKEKCHWWMKMVVDLLR